MRLGTAVALFDDVYTDNAQPTADAGSDQQVAAGWCYSSSDPGAAALAAEIGEARHRGRALNPLGFLSVITLLWSLGRGSPRRTASVATTPLCKKQLAYRTIWE